MTWIYCFIELVANTYVEDNATTLQMMGLTKAAGIIFQWYDNFNMLVSNGKDMRWCTCSTHEGRLMHFS